MKTLSNPRYGNIPYFWNVPLLDEVCIVTKDSMVGAPKLLLRTVFPDFDTLLCDHCKDNHEKITVIMKDVKTTDLEDAFKSLATGNPIKLAGLLGLEPIQDATNTDAKDDNMDNEYDIKQEVNDPEILNELNQLDEDINVQDFLGIKIETESSMLQYSCDICGFQAQTIQDRYLPM